MMEKKERIELLKHEVLPVVQAFNYFYATHSSDEVDGLLSGLIKHKAALDRDWEPLQ